MKRSVSFTLVHACVDGRSIEIPLIVFGTYKLKKRKVLEPIKLALEAGCVAFDTAFVYNNETEVAANFCFLLFFCSFFRSRLGLHSLNKLLRL